MDRRERAGLSREELVDDERHAHAETVKLPSIPVRLRRELSDRALAERSESESPKSLRRREVAEHATQRMVASDLVPVRHDQHATGEVETATHERDEVQRRRVSPLQVVDDRDHRRGGVGPRRNELGEQAMPVVGVSEVRKVSACSAGEVEHRAECPRRVQGVALRPQDLRGTSVTRAELAGQGGLAHARLARDHDQAAFAHGG